MVQAAEAAAAAANAASVAVDWMSSEQHSYGHLLQVDGGLPRGMWYAHSLAVAYADFRPQHIRWKLTPPGQLDAKHPLKI